MHDLKIEILNTIFASKTIAKKRLKLVEAKKRKTKALCHSVSASHSNATCAFIYIQGDKNHVKQSANENTSL